MAKRIMNRKTKKTNRVRVLLLLIFLCVARVAMADNTMVIIPQPEVQEVSEDVPIDKGWTPEGLKDVSPIKEEIKIIEVTKTKKPKVNNKIQAVEIYPISENKAKAYIYQHESGNNPYAVNQSSGACGIGQALPCSKMDCELGDYECQDKWFTNYMLERYGTWEKAYQFWIAHRWW